MTSTVLLIIYRYVGLTHKGSVLWDERNPRAMTQEGVTEEPQVITHVMSEKGTEVVEHSQE